ncbi:hypothetical protein BD779DRAFT_1477034 [Infundibulicybe gibba]|nr:hypothetical protein BD779DRAFT_1477034 [Infundibulicybe gibba]
MCNHGPERARGVCVVRNSCGRSTLLGDPTFLEAMEETAYCVNTRVPYAFANSKVPSFAQNRWSGLQIQAARSTSHPRPVPTTTKATIVGVGGLGTDVGLAMAETALVAEQEMLTNVSYTRDDPALFIKSFWDCEPVTAMPRTHLITPLQNQKRTSISSLKAVSYGAEVVPSLLKLSNDSTPYSAHEIARLPPGKWGREPIERGLDRRRPQLLPTTPAATDEHP